MDLVGKIVGQYRIVEPLGRGGMASVYKAYQPALDRHVAIKVLSAQPALTPEFSERFVREAKAIAQLNHPNILPVIDFGQADDFSYIVMKYVSGGTLTDRLHYPIDLAAATRIIEQIAAALDHAHSRGIIHRDVKPSNVLLDENEWVQLADFGLAKLMVDTRNLTGTGASMGTPAYLSPEQGQGAPLDHHTDIYSLGVVLYEMAVGRLPFESETAFGLILKHINQQPPLPRSIKPDLPESVEEIILKAMAKPLAERYHTAGELARVLRQAMTGVSAITARFSDPYVTPILVTPNRDTPTQVMIQTDRQLMMETVPAVPDLVGRDRELAYYRERLQRDRFVIVTGMAGVGKTTLGARLAREVTERVDHVFWFTFDQVEKSTADALFWALAAFLESHGEPNLWRYLQGEIKAQKPLDRTVKMNLLLAGLASGDYALCFDDFQIVSGMPDIAYVFKLIQQRFLDLRQNIPARIIIMGREVPPDMEHLVSGPLKGFDEAGAQAFVESRNLQLDPAELSRLWQRTEGNAKLLELSALALSHLSPDSVARANFIEALARKGDIRDYLMANIYSALKPDEQRLLGVLSIFLGAIERELAEHILEAEEVTDIVQRLEALMHRHLIDEDEDERLHCHSLVREYCYHILNRRDRERFHQLAAEYYEQDHNYLAAAYHHFERKAYAQSLDLLTANSQAIINAGGAATLIEQLKRFRRQDLNPEQQLALSKAFGAGHQIRGEYPAAIQTYELALSEEPPELIRAELLQLIGNTHLKVGEYEQALEYAAQSLATSRSGENHSHIAAVHLDMGWACFRLARMAEAYEHFSVSWQIGQKLHDRLLLAKVYAGVGMVAWKTGRLDEARVRLEGSLRIYRDYRDRTGEADTIGNLGLLYGELGDPDRQLLYYRQSLAIQESTGDVDGLRIAFNNLGYLYYSKGDYDQAVAYYGRLARLARDTGHQPMLSIAYTGLADAYRNLNKLPEALEHAEKAVQVASEFKAVMELGISYRALGDVWLSRSNWMQAQAAFESSLPLLERAHEEIEMNRARQGYSVATASLADAQSRHLAGG